VTAAGCAHDGPGEGLGALIFYVEAVYGKISIRLFPSNFYFLKPASFASGTDFLQAEIALDFSRLNRMPWNS
jgi:hypothetical protein